MVGKTIRTIVSYFWDVKAKEILRIEDAARPRFAKILDRIQHDRLVKLRRFLSRGKKLN
jgi:hypothetical protein